MYQVLCSTGALIGRPNNRNHKLLGEYASQIQCDGFEFMFYKSWYPKADEIVRDIQSMKLNIPVFHCEKGIGERISKSNKKQLQEVLMLFTVNCQVASAIGAEKMVVHLWDGVTSDRYMERNLSAYGALKEIAVENGLLLMIENVVCNQKEPFAHFCELRENDSQVAFTFDTKMAAFHHQLDFIYETKWKWLWEEQHIRHLHVNDYSGGYMDWQNLKTLHLGRGWIDFNRFFQFVFSSGYRGDFTLEATSFDSEGRVHYDWMNESIKIVRDGLKVLF